MSVPRRLVAAFAAAASLAACSAAEAGPVSVAIDRSDVEARLGETFSFRSTIRNEGDTATPSLVAHLNVLSLRPGTYVDPEDWSARRTVYVGEIPAGGERVVTWTIQAVNSGSLAVYVAALPQDRPAAPPVTGPTLQLAVADRTTINAGGVLPVALGVPLIVGLVAVGVRVARRRG